MYNTKFINLEFTDSTITFAKNYLKEQSYLLSNNVVITANTQSKGVGKLGREWVSPKGNLYFTAIFRPFKNYSWEHIPSINIFNLLVALSLLQSIKQFLPNSLEYVISCKWPNDILINTAKVGGILLENVSTQHSKLLLVSAGVNLNVAPQIGPGYSTVSIKDIGNLAIEPQEFTVFLLNNIYRNVQTLSQQEIISLWSRYAYKYNQKISIKIGNAIKAGVFRGINHEGLLLLEVDNSKIETISVGEVY